MLVLVLYLLNKIFLLPKTGDIISLFLAALVDKGLEELLILFQTVTRKSGAELLVGILPKLARNSFRLFTFTNNEIE